ncbi:response regulator transcription factor [uncultured Enterovirga sp.]|uniref:response regulator transcription factor n=1 Tax=uncultured Enterovirga sp. TaxID=2026352 RepID=UPI0035CA4F51
MSADEVIAVVDDDEAARESIMDLLRALGFVAAGFRDASEFLGSGDLTRVSCVIADFRLPGMSGLDLCARINASARAIPTVLVTAYPDETTRARALQAGVCCYLSKPLDPERLLACLASAFSTRADGATQLQRPTVRGDDPTV